MGIKTGDSCSGTSHLAVGHSSASASHSEPASSEQPGKANLIQGYLHRRSQHLGSSSQGSPHSLQKLSQVTNTPPSVIFCEAVAIYGVIMAIILQGKIGDQCSECQVWSACAFAGYALFWTGISVGFSNLFCGYSFDDSVFALVSLGRDAPSQTPKTLILLWRSSWCRSSGVLWVFSESLWALSNAETDLFPKAEHRLILTINPHISYLPYHLPLFSSFSEESPFIFLVPESR